MANEIAQFTFDSPAHGSPIVSQVVRENINSLGTTCYTTDAAYPATPRTGMMRILDVGGLATNIQLQWYYGGIWNTIITHLEALLPLAKRMVVTFAVAAAVWTINHNMDVRPLIQCFDSTDLHIVPTSIQHVQVAGNWRRIVVTHGAAIAGYAILVG